MNPRMFPTTLALGRGSSHFWSVAPAIQPISCNRNYLALRPQMVAPRLDRSKVSGEHADTKAVAWTGIARVRALPIAALTMVALIGETCALWAPRATDMPDYWRSVVLLAIALGLGAAAFRLPRLCRLPAVAA